MSLFSKKQPELGPSPIEGKVVVLADLDGVDVTCVPNLHYAKKLKHVRAGSVWRLQNSFILVKKGFIPIIPPVMIKSKSMEAMGYIDSEEDRKRIIAEAMELYGQHKADNETSTDGAVQERPHS